MKRIVTFKTSLLAGLPAFAISSLQHNQMPLPVCSTNIYSPKHASPDPYICMHQVQDAGCHYSKVQWTAPPYLQTMVKFQTFPHSLLSTTLKGCLANPLARGLGVAHPAQSSCIHPLEVQHYLK